MRLFERWRRPPQRSNGLDKHQQEERAAAEVEEREAERQRELEDHRVRLQRLRDEVAVMSRENR